MQGALATTDPDAYAEALNQVYKRLWEEQWAIGVGYMNIPWGMGPKIIAWEPFRFAFFPSGLHTIRVE